MSALTAGNTYKFTLTATKDGSVWDLTGASVALLLRKPDGTLVTKAATIDDAAAGTAHFTLAASDLDTPGVWTRSWEVTDSGIVLESEGTLFRVEPGLN